MLSPNNTQEYGRQTGEEGYRWIDKTQGRDTEYTVSLAS